MNLGERISFERKNKGFSQELLAENSGISLRTIQRIENNKSKPRPYTIKVIADTLNLKIDALVEERNTDSDLLPSNYSLSKINLINSSALFGILIPLFNIVAPIIFWRLYKGNPLVNEKGKKIISFQILWFLISMLILLITHFLHYKITGGFISSRIPIIVLVYISLLIINVFLIIRSSILLRKRKTEIYSFIPHSFLNTSKCLKNDVKVSLKNGLITGNFVRNKSLRNEKTNFTWPYNLAHISNINYCIFLFNRQSILS